MRIFIFVPDKYSHSTAALAWLPYWVSPGNAGRELRVLVQTNTLPELSVTGSQPVIKGVLRKMIFGFKAAR